MAQQPQSDNQQRYRPTRHVPKQARAQERIRQILLSAARVVEREGIDKITTNLIASEAGLPVGSVYKYFDNKQTVLVSLLNLYCDDFTERIEKLTKSPFIPQDTPEALGQSLIEVWSSYVSENKPLAVCNALESDPAYRPKATACQTRITTSIARLITTHGVPDDEAAGRALAVLMMLTQYSALQLNSDQTSQAAAEHVRQAIGHIFSGYQ